MDTKNSEVWVGNRMKFLLDEDNILNVTVFGEVDAETAYTAKKVVLTITSSVKEKIGVLVDLNKAGKQSPEARKTWDEINEEKDSLVALFGMHYVAKVIASFFMKFTTSKNIRFFNDKEQALKWLKHMQQVK